ncbi:phosphate regulon sensor histidine kinase PhoR [Pseudomonas matsuisoli]|uniref:Phosphate regulon sensor protein PhoR n=1 Tax=Pseudomonas matsuisoli TaxID=1515666 RepID=A0A917PV68_9PSED|nr:phosphate regulon sensor histidine kinase PhoR [Pseudomonas matsuisoli]GGJ94291.1 phosphate regulon sensor protein PhoR [Pseudomonas matsuisoli]
MNSNWRHLLIRHAILLITVALVLGFITGAYGWSMALALAGYLAWILRDLMRLRSWLEKADLEADVPEAKGVWEELFDQVYHLQRRSRQSRDRLQAIIDRAQESTTALRDAVIMVDNSGNLEWWNPAAESLLGLKEPQDVGQPIANLLRHPRFKDYFESGNHAVPLEIASPVNDRVRIQFTITRYGNDEHLMLVRDVTRVHQLEQMRKDFVANVSHELRTPLTVITGYLETLLDNSEGANPRWRRAMEQMQQQATRMQSLLNDLLLLARLEATDYPSDNHPVPMLRVLSSIKTDAQALSAERAHHIVLEADANLSIKGSETELRSAFSNLVFNAVKYTPEKGEIRIRCWRDENGAYLSVQDNGPGIDAKHLPRLTERFYRVDSSRASKTGGTGLGLAIVKHVLLRHKGRLDIESTLLRGSVFTCHFPPSQIVED